MRRSRWLRASGISLLALCFVVLALLWTAPADVAYRVLRPRLDGWQAQGLSGSLWRGRAEQVALHGMPLGALEWNVSRPAFFSGTTRGTASLQGNGLALTLAFEKRGSKAALRDVQLRLPAQWLAPAMALPGLVPLGEVEATLPELTLVDGYLAHAVGELVWRGVGVSGAAEGSIGDVDARFADAEAGTVTLVVRDLDARLGISGRVVFNGPAFELEVTLTPREPNLQLFEVLRLVGQRTADGGTFLRARGQMQPLF